MAHQAITPTFAKSLEIREKTNAIPCLVRGCLDVSIDYLVGEGKHASFDKETIKRLRGIENLDIETKTTLFRVIDTFLRDAKARSAYS